MCSLISKHMRDHVHVYMRDSVRIIINVIYQTMIILASNVLWKILMNALLPSGTLYLICKWLIIKY